MAYRNPSITKNPLLMAGDTSADDYGLNLAAATINIIDAFNMAFGSLDLYDTNIGTSPPAAMVQQSTGTTYPETYEFGTGLTRRLMWRARLPMAIQSNGNIDIYFDWTFRVPATVAAPNDVARLVTGVITGNTVANALPSDASPGIQTSALTSTDDVAVGTLIASNNEIYTWSWGPLKPLKEFWAGYIERFGGHGNDTYTNSLVHVNFGLRAQRTSGT